MSIELRPYQHQTIHDLRQGFAEGHRRQIVGSPTGSGKTVLAAAIAELAKRKNGSQAWFLCDRTPLIGQTVRSFEALGLNVGMVWRDLGDHRGDEDVVVASTQTLASRYRRTGRLPDSAGMVIIDEAHILHSYHVELMTRWDALPIVGLSATPMRRGLGLHFTRLVRGPSIAELVEQGYLVGFRAYGPSEPDLRGVRIKAGDFVESDLADVMSAKEVIGDVVSNWERLGDNRSTIVFAVNIAHSTSLVDAFCAAGHAAAHIDCHTKEPDRERIYADFRAGEIKILSSVAVLSLGFDVPSVGCVVMARPTMSEALYIQQAGRGTRLSDGKQDCLLLDHAGNVARFGLPQRFVVPDLDTRKPEERERTKRSKQRKAEPCPECSAMMEPHDRECPECGHAPRRKNAVGHRDAQLVSLDGGDSRLSPEDRKRTYLELIHYAQSRGWSGGWAYHKFIEKFGTKPPFAWRDLEPVPPSPATMRWVKSRMIAWAKGNNANQRAHA